MIDAGFVTVPQPFLRNRTIWCPRAKVTGGCGSHNAMVWILGNRRDFDERWGPIDGWTWDDDLKNYWTLIEDAFDTEIVDTDDPFVAAFIASAQRNGYAFNADPNDLSNNGQGGVSARRFMGEITADGRALRESSWTAFVEPILSERANLEVIVYSRVNRVLFDGATAMGVEVFGIGDGKTRSFFASKEVILSAGVIDSPKILMLSGVGDCAELEVLGIECVAEVRGVGKAFQDHTFNSVWSPSKRR